MNAKYYISYEGLLTAAALYIVITYVTITVFRRVERRYLRHLNLEADRKKGPGAARLSAIATQHAQRPVPEGAGRAVGDRPA